MKKGSTPGIGEGLGISHEMRDPRKILTEEVEVQMDPQENFENQKALIDFARQKVREIFPDTNINQHSYDAKYDHFPAVEHYFEYVPIIDPPLIKKLKEGGRLLSVGVGPAKLEHLLYKGFNLSKDALTLADIELSSEALQSGLGTVAFDMREEWPSFDEKFDYILFPESFGVAKFVDVYKEGSLGTVQRFFEDMREVSDIVISGNTLETSDDRWKFAKMLIEMDLPWTMKKYHAIFCAVNTLKKGGELRFSGHLMGRDELTYVAMKLKEDFGKEVETTFEPYLKIKLHNPLEASST